MELKNREIDGVHYSPIERKQMQGGVGDLWSWQSIGPETSSGDDDDGPRLSRLMKKKESLGDPTNVTVMTKAVGLVKRRPKMTEEEDDEI